MKPLSIDRKINNNNKSIAKTIENFFSAQIQIDGIIGLGKQLSEPIHGQNVLALNQQQILYHTCEIFVVMNLISKDYRLIHKNLVPQKTITINPQVPLKKQQPKNKRIFMMQKIYLKNSYRKQSTWENTALVFEKQENSLNIYLINAQKTAKLQRSSQKSNGSKNLLHPNMVKTAIYSKNSSHREHQEEESDFVQEEDKCSDFDFKTKTKIENSNQIKCIKLNGVNEDSQLTSMCHNPLKNYLYLLITEKLSQHPEEIVPSTLSQNTKCYLKQVQYRQFLLVIDLGAGKLLLKNILKTSPVQCKIKFVIIPFQQCENLIFIGDKYFREWKINFNEKSLKESNQRNIQRALKEFSIIDWTVTKPSYLQQFKKQKYHKKSQSIAKDQSKNQKSTITQNMFLFLLTQQYLTVINLATKNVVFLKPETTLNNNRSASYGIEQELQNSLSQIYKMKFIFDELDDKNDDNDIGTYKKLAQDHIQQASQIKMKFACISDCWRNNEQDILFTIGSNLGRVFLYKISIKTLNEINKLTIYQGGNSTLSDSSNRFLNRSKSANLMRSSCKTLKKIQEEGNDFKSRNLKLQYQYILQPNNEKSKKQEIKENIIQNISISNNGQTIVLSTYPIPNIYLINRFFYNNQQPQIEPLWGKGNPHHSSISCIESSQIKTMFLTTSEKDKQLKLWSANKKCHSISIEKEYKNSVLGITMHPCGHIFAINFEKQIKLLSIVSETFNEITSLKNLNSCLQIKYSNLGNFLISIQGGRIKFYEPFTLKAICSLQVQDLKLVIVQFCISDDDEYIFFQCSDYSIHCRKLDLDSICRSNTPSEKVQQCHKKLQPYTCFFYDNKVKDPSQLNLNMNYISISDTRNSQDDLYDNTYRNLFVGFTKKKYMVIYGNEGKKLISEFSVRDDCYVTDFAIETNLLFLGTNKGTIRIYNWPILENNLLMQLVDAKTCKVRFLQPSFKQIEIWLDKDMVVKMHRLKFSKELIVGNSKGNIAILAYTKTRANKKYIDPLPVTAERKKMQKIINELSYVKSLELQKRQKLIEKTQNDILKVENQIIRQKNIRQEQLKDQQWQIQNNFIRKNIQEGDERQTCIDKENNQLALLQSLLQTKKNQFEQKKMMLKAEQQRKKNYEIQRNNNLKMSTQEVIKNYKNKIAQQIQIHKNAIRLCKNKYQQKIKQKQKEFAQFAQEYELTTQKILAKTNNQSIQQKTYFFDELGQPSNQSIQLLRLKVIQQEKNNKQLKQQHLLALEKISTMEIEDENLQHVFQQQLQLYNKNRFQNLYLHSEVLKMQNQLIERKQVLKNKQDVISLAYMERNKLENFRELVQGQLTKMQSKKEELFKMFVKKQNDMNVSFQELIEQISKLDHKKLQISDLTQACNYFKEQNNECEMALIQKIQQLKELKKFLLLQGLNQDAQQKRLYQERQSLQASINWLKKRLYMSSINEGKSMILKKATLSQILKQNKNLLQQCNLLRGQGLDYQNEIKNFKKKLRQANNIINIESKLKNQTNAVQQQKNQLEKIRMLFKVHLQEQEQAKRFQNGIKDDKRGYFGV